MMRWVAFIRNTLPRQRGTCTQHPGFPPPHLNLERGTGPECEQRRNRRDRVDVGSSGGRLRLVLAKKHLQLRGFQILGSSANGQA
jgi:hypothetical protein